MSGGVPALSNIFGNPVVPAKPAATAPIHAPPPSRGTDAAGEGSTARVGTPTASERREALSIALGVDGRRASASTVTNFLRQPALIAAADAGLRTVKVKDRIRFALVPIPSPGRTTLLLVPGKLPRRPAQGLLAAIAATIEDACRRQKAAGIDLVQMLLPPGATELAQLACTRCGFWHLADLHYLQKRARRAAAGNVALPPGWRMAPYSASAHPLFEEAIRRSYEDSLDCPQLAGRRVIEDIIRGHKAAGEFKPALWRVLLRDRGDGQPPLPQGVLLLSGLGVGGTAGVELVYLGLAPEARGLGLGQRLLSMAESAAAATHGRTLVLAVDAQNEPALRLYRSHRLRQTQVRRAFLRDLNER